MRCVNEAGCTKHTAHAATTPSPFRERPAARTLHAAHPFPRRGRATSTAACTQYIRNPPATQRSASRAKPDRIFRGKVTGTVSSVSSGTQRCRRPATPVPTASSRQSLREWPRLCKVGVTSNDLSFRRARLRGEAARCHDKLELRKAAARPRPHTIRKPSGGARRGRRSRTVAAARVPPRVPLPLRTAWRAWRRWSSAASACSSCAAAATASAPCPTATATWRTVRLLRNRIAASPSPSLSPSTGSESGRGEDEHRADKPRAPHLATSGPASRLTHARQEGGVGLVRWPSPSRACLMWHANSAGLQDSRAPHRAVPTNCLIAVRFTAVARRQPPCTTVQATHDACSQSRVETLRAAPARFYCTVQEASS